MKNWLSRSKFGKNRACIFCTRRLGTWNVSWYLLHTVDGFLLRLGFHADKLFQTQGMASCSHPEVAFAWSPGDAVIFHVSVSESFLT